jgi:hypothetical protein
MQLASLMRNTDEERARGDEWRAKIETARAEITEEKEQFFATKWRDAQIVSLFHPIREPPPIEFVGGQSARPMIPYLRLLGPRAGGATARMSLGRLQSGVQPCMVLPALRPLNTDR